MFSSETVSALNDELQGKTPKEILQRVREELDSVVLAFSGAEDVLLVHLAARLSRPPAFLTLDTGRLHAETLQFINDVQKHYKIPIEALKPEQNEVDKLIKNKGLYSFYKDGHEECCGIRKVAPLRRKLAQYDAWITGQRRDQSPTRNEVAVIEIDRTFSIPDHQILKVNPLANVTSKEVWETIRMLEIPYNPLHDRGYVSIGCEPCTRSIGPHQHEREGRWWWEEATIKECGLHKGNLDILAKD
ncbi:MAG: phosphoadenylyl-sulfate reductase [Proteobacteria bacterium]|nr:phosphoadenylyl-sulfate reductase [Pseudomonadota bacterium]MDA0927394.1 phosphoadenylyl-sulfate reductase [Pseudomonadota bacterium]